MKITIVGSGLSGTTAAVLLKRTGHQVEIFETRSHIGGNCYDSNLCGTLVHNYGPHSFHTNDDEVFEFLSKFTEWVPFFYRPKGNTELGLISLPYSLKTIQELGRSLLEDEIINYIFKDYSEKQWGVSFDKIPNSILSRIPKAQDKLDPTWFDGEKHQCLPKLGYTQMINNMLDGIKTHLCCGDRDWSKNKSDLVIYTGRIDEYFCYCYGPLKYRSLTFEHLTSSSKMNCCVINQNTKNVPYTRIYDHSYFSANHTGPTIITKEYPKDYALENDIPFYPMGFIDNNYLYQKYNELSKKDNKIIFLGRLGKYKYLDMWAAVRMAINTTKQIS